MKKINLILLSLIAAIPSGYLVFELGKALTLGHIWDKKLLGGMVVGTGIIALLAIVWPLVYALAFYGAPASAAEESDAGSADTAGDEEVTDVGEEEEGFHEEDLDAFEGQDTDEASEVEDYEEASGDEEFEVDEDQIEDIESEDYDLGDESFEDLDEFEEEEEEAPKSKAKKKKK